MKSLAISALAALCMSAPAVHAATFAVDYQVPGQAFGTQGWFEPVTIDSEVFDGTFDAGQFELSSSTLGNFFAFCIEVTQGLRDGEDYTITPDLFDSGVIDNIDRLFSSAYGLVTDSLSAAGFQVALWEIVEDTATGLDLSTGTFSAVDAPAASGSVIATAQGFLDGLASADTGLYEIDFLASPASQDVVTARLSNAVAPIPLPASGLMLLTAGGLVLLRRRKAG